MKRILRQTANSILNPLGLELIRKSNVVSNLGLINDGAYWDEYVLQWERSDKSKNLDRVGNEWKNEEIFLALLEKHSSPESKALEIGCGGGRITHKSVRWFKHVYACDVSKEMIKKTKESVGAENVSFHSLDGFTLSEFADESLDCVFSHDVFVHFSSLQVYPYFKEIKRVLKKGGVGVISFYNLPVHFDSFKEFSLFYNRHRIYPPHLRLHYVTEEMLNLMLRDLALDVVEVDRTNYLIPIIRK